MTKFVIHGLRRSGTTILWETLRTDPSLTCFDEPFHPRFAGGARQNAKGTWNELALAADMVDATPAAICPEGELNSDLDENQRSWFIAICESAPFVVTDLVRAWNRVLAIDNVLNGAAQAHLVRDPANWVAAHLAPSGKSAVIGRASTAYRRASFFSRRGFYDDYQYQTIISAAIECQHPVLDWVSPSVEALARMPAFMKLLAFWWGANVTVSKALAQCSGPTMTVTLDAFSRKPGDEIGRIKQLTTWQDLSVNTARVKPVKESFGSTSPQWLEAAEVLGIPSVLFNPVRRSAAEFAAAFRNAKSQK